MFSTAKVESENYKKFKNWIIFNDVCLQDTIRTLNRSNCLLFVISLKYLLLFLGNIRIESESFCR